MAIPREYENIPNPDDVVGPSVDKEELTDDSGEVQELVQNPEEVENREASGIAHG